MEINCQKLVKLLSFLLDSWFHLAKLFWNYCSPAVFYFDVWEFWLIVFFLNLMCYNKCNLLWFILWLALQHIGKCQQTGIHYLQCVISKQETYLLEYSLRFQNLNKIYFDLMPKKHCLWDQNLLIISYNDHRFNIQVLW